MKLLPLAALVALSLSAASALSQTVELNIGTKGYNCGRITTNTYCYGIPTVTVENGVTTANGSIWIDAQPKSNALGENTTGGFIVINGQEHQITGPVVWSRLSLSGGTAEYTFTGGTIAFTYTAYYSAGGGGRGGAGAGYRWVIQSGTLELD